MFEIEKSLDALRLAANEIGKISKATFEKSETGPLHAVKRLVRPADGGKPYYRTYWMASYNEANNAASSIANLKSARNSMISNKEKYERSPDTDWRKTDYESSKSAYEEHLKNVNKLDNSDKVVKVEDKKPSQKKQVSPYQHKVERLKEIDEEIEDTKEQWKQWAEDGPKKAQEKAHENYKKILEDEGLKVENEGYMGFKVVTPKGVDLLTIGHEVSYKRNNEDPVFKIKMYGFSSDTSEPENFEKFGELSDAMAKVKKLIEDKEKFGKMKEHFNSFADAKTKGNHDNEYSDKIDALEKERSELSKSTRKEKIADVIEELGNESFELKDHYTLGSGKRPHRYGYAVVLKTTPKQVKVGFSDHAGDINSYHATENMTHGHFQDFIGNYVDLDAHLPDYVGVEKQPERRDDGSSTAIAKVVAERDALRSQLVRYFDEPTLKRLNDAQKFLGEVNMFTKDDFVKQEPKIVGWDKENGFVKEKNVSESSASEKQVTNHASFVHPSGGKINKGDKVTFDHKGVQKEGTVMGTNVYKKFANPYVKMKGDDGKMYEIVISKVNPSDGGASGKK